jgi:hypothetical protein
MIGADQIKEHMEVKGADGQHVGVVDHMEGADKIKLTKNDPSAGGHHHLIPLAWVDRVDAQAVYLAKPSDAVFHEWEHSA